MRNSRQSGAQRYNGSFKVMVLFPRITREGAMIIVSKCVFSNLQESIEYFPWPEVVFAKISANARRAFVCRLGKSYDVCYAVIERQDLSHGREH